MENHRPDDFIMAIFSEISGRFEIDPDSGGPLESCAYSKLINLRRISDSLASAGGGDSGSIVFLYNEGRQITT